MKNYIYRIATDQENGIIASFIKSILFLLTGVYSGVLTVHSYLYKVGIAKTYHLPRPVVSIGNITVGGVGKTPFVAMLAKSLQERGIKSVILIRGYMDQRDGANNEFQSDEAQMLKKKLGDVPVLVGKNRAQKAYSFLENNDADIFILDDGFQHKPLFRNLNIVLIDSTNPWGNGCLLPRGILRESRRALQRADMLILTKADLGSKNVGQIKKDIKSINPKAGILEAVHQPVVLEDLRQQHDEPLEFLKGEKVCLLSSIGQPRSFEETIGKVGGVVLRHFSFMDHYIYQEKDIQRIVRLCGQNKVDIVITTQKDRVKIEKFLEMFDETIKVFALTIELSIKEGKEEFLERVVHLSQR